MRAPEWNDPEEFVVSLMTCPVDTLVIAIWAPATTAPEGSLTVPTMLPVPTVVWVNDRGATLKSATPVRSGRAATDESFIALTVISHRLMAADQRGGTRRCISGRTGGVQAVGPC